MSSALQVPPITVEQYEDFQGHPGLRDELIHGRIVMSPQPKPLHRQVGKNIMRLLDAALEGQAYTAQQNSNLKFTGLNSMPAPDVFVTSNDLWNRACLENRYLSEAPILVVEVLSKANRKKAVLSKVELYLERHVQEIWLVYPPASRGRAHYSVLPQYGCRSTKITRPLTGVIEVAEFFALAR